MSTNDDKQEASVVPEMPLGWLPGPITLEQMEVLASYFAARIAGPARSTPRTCRGQDCPVAAECPLLVLGIDPPVGRQCFVELNLLKNFMETAIKEVEGAESSLFDQNTIGAIAFNNLFIKRLAETLAGEEVIINTLAAISEDGQQIMELKPHPSLISIERITRQIQMLQRDLLVTRKEKSRDDARHLLSPTEVMDKLRVRMEAVREGIEAGQQELLEHQTDIVEADFTIKEDEPPKKEEQKEVEQKKEEGKEVTPERDPQTGFLIENNGDAAQR